MRRAKKIYYIYVTYLTSEMHDPMIHPSKEDVLVRKAAGRMEIMSAFQPEALWADTGCLFGGEVEVIFEFKDIRSSKSAVARLRRLQKNRKKLYLSVTTEVIKLE